MSTSDEAHSGRLGPAVHRATADAIDIETVYQEHHDFVWRSLRRLGVPTHQVDDALQEVFLAAARRLGEFEHRAALSTWLFAIALRVAQRLRRGTAMRARQVARLRGFPDDQERGLSEVDSTGMRHVGSSLVAAISRETVRRI